MPGNATCAEVRRARERMERVRDEHPWQCAVDKGVRHVCHSRLVQGYRDVLCDDEWPRVLQG